MRNKKHITLSLDYESIEILDKLSKETGLTKSKIISKLIENANVKTILTLKQ